MGTGTAEDARRWLAARGVRQAGDDAWTDDEHPGRRFTTNEIAHSRAHEVFVDDDLDAEGRVRLAFGLLDLLDDYGVTCEIRMADRGPDGPLPSGALWDGYRRRLEAERDGTNEPAFDRALLVAASEPSLASLVAGERTLFRYRTEALSGQKAQLRERIKQLHDEASGLEGQKEAKRLELQLVEKELEGIRELWEKKLIPSTRMMALERERARLGGEAGKLEAMLAQTKGKVAETELQIIEIDQTSRTDVAKQLADIRAKTSELTEKRATALDQSERIDIRAPQAGIVLGLAVHTLGGVVAAGEQLMQIVPENDALIAEARVRPIDVDQVRVGQPARLRFSNLNQRTTPEIDGHVIRVSADAVKDERVDQPYYIVRLRFDRGSIPGEAVLLPGMPVEVFIRTDPRSLASYLVKPMADQMRRAFREK